MTTLYDIGGEGSPAQTIDWDLRQVVHLINKKFLPLIFDLKRFLVLVGGAGSGKSHFIAQYFIVRILAAISRGIKHNILALRKTSPSVRYSVFALFKHYITEWGLRSLVDIKESTMEINWMGGSRIRCTGMDDPEKIKSFEGLTSAWPEETTEFHPMDITQLNLRLRGKSRTKKQIVCSFNPIDQNSFLNDRFFENDRPKLNDPTATVMHSTYEDNDFLNDPEYVAELESLKEQDMNLWNIYGAGLWGVLKNLIYNNYDIIADEDWPEFFDEIFYGMDFGYAKETALIEIGIRDDEVYERELIYKRKMQNADRIETLRALEVDPNSEIFADPSEPEFIDEIHDAGFNIKPANNKVSAGLNTVNTKHAKILASSLNLLNEKKKYMRKEDKDGNVLEDPVKAFDHLMDAERYAFMGYFNPDGKSSVWFV